MISNIRSLIEDFEPGEIEDRLNDIFNGYLGCDTGGTLEDLQVNHHLIRRIAGIFREIEGKSNEH